VIRVETARLVLASVDVAAALRIRDRRPSSSDAWADGYPFEGDLAAIGGFLAGISRGDDVGAFRYFQISRRSDGLAIGGIGFKGRPDDGTVEIGYGLIPTARGNGYAAEALTALLAIGRDYGVARISANTTLDNRASRRTLERAGFTRIAGDTQLIHYQIEL
jgi:RimJ/RimL family protein N-acetyltransferase